MKIRNLILISILFNLGFIFVLRLVSDLIVGNNDDIADSFFMYSVWIYCAAYLYLTIILITKIIRKSVIVFGKLFIIKICLIILVFAWSSIFKNSRFWELNKLFYNYTLIDDAEYYENPDADDDPIYGSPAGGYSTTFKFFTSSGTELDGLKLPIGTIQKDEDSHYYIDQDNVSLIGINLTKAVFWQYAIITGYQPIKKEEYKTGNFISNFYLIGPFYILELIIKNIGSTILFAVIVLLINKIKPKYLFTEYGNK